MHMCDAGLDTLLHPGIISCDLSALSQVYLHDIFKNLCCFSVTSLYAETRALLLYVKISGSLLILHSVKDAVVNTY